MNAVLTRAPASVAVSALLAEIDTLRAQIVRLQQLADTDCLTQIANRRLLVQELWRAIQMTARHKSRAALALLDIDGLKSINDELGHLAGDRVLGHVAARLKQAFRQTDIVGRLAGDEFMLVLHHADQAEANDRMAQFAARLMDDPAITPNGPVTVRLSWGTADIKADDAPEQVLGRADAAMYRLKRAQRSDR